MIRVVSHKSRWLLIAALMGGTVAPLALAPRAALAQAPTVLGPEDVISVQVAKHPEMSLPEVMVGANGKVSIYQGVKDIPVGGKSIQEAQRLIEQAFRSQLRKPQVSVGLVRSRIRQVSVLGAVVKAGPVDLRPGLRVSQVLAAAGGASMPLEHVKGSLTHGKVVTQLNLSEIQGAPLGKADLVVKEGDVLNIVPVPTYHVTVSGGVTTPGLVTLRNSPRVFDAIVAAGSLLDKPEVMRGTLMRRDATKTSLDLAAIFEDQSSAKNLTIKDGDILNLEAVHTNIMVTSTEDLVKSPGQFQFGPDVTVVDALMRANGLTIPAEGVVASIRRGSEVLPVNIVQAVYDPSKDIKMRDGDVLLFAFPEGPRISITGAVARPGSYRVKENSTLLDAVVNNGGGLTFKPDQIRLSVLRTLPDGKQVTLNVDAVALFDLRDLGQNLRMQNGDLIIINQGAISKAVFVAGEVVNRGSYDVSPKDSLSEVILRAGGPTPMALLSQVTVKRRDGSTQSVDASGAFKPNAPKVEFPISEGDTIIIPTNPNQVLVMNAVTNPGYYPIPEGRTLTVGDAILAAGGPRANAKIKEIAILHRDPDGKVTKQTISLAAVQNGILSIDVPLRNEDVIYVPEGKVGPNALSRAVQVVAGLTTFGRAATIF